MTSYKRLIALDFDGVLHAYTSPWTDAATISDGPTPGAMAFLRSLVEDDRFDVVIVSSRCKEPAGVQATRDWLAIYFTSAGTDDVEGTEEKIVASVMLGRLLKKIQIVSYRPPAHITIDDRAMRFEGQWPDLDRLAAFRPWNKGGKAGFVVEASKDPSRLEAIRNADLAPGAILDLPSPMVDLDLLHEVARRAYAAGCGMIEYHEEDCQVEVGTILDDVLRRRVTA